MSDERIDLAQLEEMIESIVICEDEYIMGTDNLLKDCRTLKDRMQIILAELKRCYEELDEANQIETALWNTLDNWDMCMDDYSMHDLYEDLDEKYTRDDDDDGRIILKELYSYTEEDGWQPKEPASE
jgi:hypothetical protein